MKLSKFANLVKNGGRCAVLHVAGSGIWLSTGTAIYRGGKACKNAREQNCPDVVFTNADRVREMNDEELAKFMLSSNGAAYCKNNDRDSTCYLKGRDGMTACELCALDWLREEAE